MMSAYSDGADSVEKRLFSERRRHVRHSRRPSNAYVPVDRSSIDIRVGNRRAQSCYNSIRVRGPADAGLFARLIHTAVRANPNDPLVIAVNGHAQWLEDILDTCIDDHYSQPDITNREVQFSDTVQFPQKSDRKTKWVPWTFIVDQMNLPEVYYWTFRIPFPPAGHLSDVATFRLRMGAWTCGRGAYKGDDRVAVVILFTRHDIISENIVTNLLFQHLSKDADYDSPRMDEEGLCWLFLHLYELLTDWQNIIRDIERRLSEAELNSRGRNIPVKMRTRTMHREVDRIFALSEYLRFHSRSFKKLAKLKGRVPEAERTDPVWDQTDDAMDDLETWAHYLDSLKERFNNLIELEFNIENASQSDSSRFLAILGTLFLPVSFLASVFGISSVNWPVVLYAELAVPLFVVSAAFTILFPLALARWQDHVAPTQKVRLGPSRGDFTMLGDELPDGADAPGQVGRAIGLGVGEKVGMAEPRRKSVDVESQRNGSRRRRRAKRAPDRVGSWTNEGMDGAEDERERRISRSRTRSRSQGRRG